MPKIKDFDELDASVSWREPVAVLKRSEAIEGADDRLLGTWLQEACMPSADPSSACLRLIVERASSGEVTGSVSFVDDVDAPDRFQPARDASVGYPTDVKPSDYHRLHEDPNTNIRYRILDGQLDEGRLSFSWSRLDLWHEWCGLQTPYRWQMGDQASYFCVPQDAVLQSTIDEGKVVLCTRGDFDASWCESDEWDGSFRRCDIAYCFCDSQGCDADLSKEQYRVDLKLDTEEALTGIWYGPFTTSVSVKLRKVVP